MIDSIYECPADVEDVDFSLDDREQGAVPANYHLPNFFGEFPVFGRKRKCPGRHAELFEDCGSEFPSPLLGRTLAPELTAPFVRLAHVRLGGLLDSHSVPLH